jgi:hypothetical protein
VICPLLEINDRDSKSRSQIKPAAFANEAPKIHTAFDRPLIHAFDESREHAPQPNGIGAHDPSRESRYVWLPLGGNPMPKKLVGAAWLAIVLLTPAPGSAAPSDAQTVVAVVNVFNDGLNKGDMKAAAAAYAPSASIIDEFPPHIWTGPSALQDWAKDFGADSQKHGVTEPVMTLEKPRHVTIEGDRAYAVIPALYAFKEQGKAVKEPGIFTFALQKLGADWKITAWSWTRK